MKERCRFCYKAIEAEFCKNIFNNKQTNPSICKIVEMLTNLTIVESDPYTKLTCMDCFDVLILFYHFRESVLQTNQLLINDKINNTNNNNNNLNFYNKWPGIVRDNNRRFILIDISLHRESHSANEDREINENQDSNRYNEQSSANQDVLSFVKQEFDVGETCVKIGKNIERIWFIIIFLLNPYILLKFIVNSKHYCFINVSESDSHDEDEKLDENDYYLSIQVTDDNNVTVCGDNKIRNNNSDSHCLDITKGVSNVEEFASIIDADSNVDSNKSVDSDKVNDIEVVYVQDYNERHLERTNVECQKEGESDQHENYIKHSKLPYQCNFCDKRFRLNGILKRHLLIHTGEKPHHCNICDKKFTSKDILNRHLLTHTGEKPHQCNICNKKFTQKVHLKQHSLLHTGVRPHQCNICEKSFTLNGDLKKHLLTHTNDKPYQCNICDKRFTLKSYLKQHSLIHTGEKPHQCDVCNERFIRKGHLKQHLMKHTGERPHQCNICGKTFTLNTDLKRHFLTHTNKKPYRCNICDKEFIRKQHLNQHLLTHTDERPHQCNICDEKFKRKQHLKKHILRHAGEKCK